MDSCDCIFGSTVCRRRDEVKRCIYGCSYLEELSDDELLQMIVEYIVDKDDVTKARNGDDIARTRVIESSKSTISYLVDSVLAGMSNPRVNMEAEDIKAELLLAVDITINSFESDRSSFNTYLRIQIRGELSNILRKLTTTNKRKVTFSRRMKSINTSVSTGDDDSQILTIGDMLPYIDTTFDDTEVEEFIQELADDEGQIIRLMIEGYGKKEIFSILQMPEIKGHEVIASIEIKTKDFLHE